MSYAHKHELAPNVYDLDARRRELEPALAAVALQAKQVYTFLRPEAVPINERVEREPGLYFQEMQRVGSNGDRIPVADILTIGLDSGVDLQLRHYEAVTRAVRWQITRSVDDGTATEETRISQLAVPRLQADGGYMDMSVEKFSYMEDRRRTVNKVCTYENNFINANMHIAGITDLLSTLQI